jgi:hypothetical protein
MTHHFHVQTNDLSRLHALISLLKTYSGKSGYCPNYYERPLADFLITTPDDSLATLLKLGWDDVATQAFVTPTGQILTPAMHEAKKADEELRQARSAQEARGSLLALAITLAVLFFTTAGVVSLFGKVLTILF